MQTILSTPNRTAATPPELGRWAGPVCAYLAVVLLVTLPGIGSTGLVMMEGMVVDTAETMVASGDFIVPRLYGEIYSYKPPLVYWTTALAIEVAGRTESAVRLPSALAGIAFGLFVLVWVGRLTRPRTGLFAAFAAVTGILFIQKMKIAEFDAPLAAATGIAVTAACCNLAADRARRSAWIWLIGYGALAAAFLIKGVPALMAYIPGLLVAATVTRGWKELLSRAHVLSALLATLIVAGYLWMAFEAAGTAVLDQPLAEARARGFEWSLQTVRGTLLKPLTVWVVLLPWSLVWPWGFGRGAITTLAQPAERRLMRAGQAFLVAGLITFMAVPTAQTRYYLPLAAAGAIVTALALERVRREPGRAVRCARALATLSALVAIAFAFLPHFAAGAQVVVLVVGLAVLAAVYGVPRLERARGIGSVLLLAALCGWAMDTWAVRPRRASLRDLSPVARVLGDELPPTATVWTLGLAADVGKNASLYYYLERPVRTFRAGQALPAAGSYLILTPSEVELLGRAVAASNFRLSLVRGVDHPRGRFELYRIAERARRPARRERSAPGPSIRERSAASGLVAGS